MANKVKSEKKGVSYRKLKFRVITEFRFVDMPPLLIDYVQITMYIQSTDESCTQRTELEDCT